MYQVIIADDEYFLRKELKLTVPWEEHGFELIYAAKDGIDAKEAVLKYKPHLLITDIKMPRMDGLSLVKELRELDALSGLKIIIISGFNEFDFVLEALRLGVIDFLLKPINDDHLVRNLEKIKNQLDSQNISEEEELTSKLNKADTGNIYVKKAQAYIEKNYKKDIVVKEVAEYLNISESYLSKLFVRVLDMRFSEYVNYYKIIMSIDLLKENRLKIHEIAYEVGFNDYKYYSSVFKKVIGLTPTEYRSKSIGAE